MPDCSAAAASGANFRIGDAGMVCARFASQGKSSRQCFLLDKPKRTFAFDGGCAQCVMPNADASGYCRFTLDQGDFGTLARRRKSPAARPCGAKISAT